MNITAIAIGSRGDVQPFAELGKELVRRGHHFKVGAFPRFREYVESCGLEFAPINGDGDLMMRLLLSECKDGLDYLRGLKILYNKNPEMIDQAYEAIKGSDAVLYILLGGFVRHACDLLGIPCVRCFFYPFDKTDKFSVQIPEMKRNNPMVGFTYIENEIGMNMVTCSLLNKWRSEHGLKKWTPVSSYLRMNGKPVLTLYPFSEMLVPREPKWGDHIYITGNWMSSSETDYVPDENLKKFLESGEPPIYIGFGSIVFKDMEKVQRTIFKIIRKNKIRAVMSSGWMKWQTENDPNICYVDFVPHEWLFGHVRGVIHHGGAGTTAAGLRCGCQTFVLAFGGDQLFWGIQTAERGLGPHPVNIHGGKWTAAEIEKGLLELRDGKYSERAKKFGRKFAKEKGCENAADILERYFDKK